MNRYRYDGSRKLTIKTFDCGETGEFAERHEAIREFTENLEQINEYQQKLFAEQKEGIIFIFQAMDAAGKDGAVRAVLSCLSPQGVSEHSFKVPSAEENRHDYLWRFWDAIPEKGSISIFNRSYYEDVLVQKIHKIYEKNLYADRIDLSTMIDGRYEQIRNFEKYLWENSIRVVKIFLNVSKEEQAKRFISRIDVQKKNWKFSSGDIDERACWDEYMAAYETAINRTARKNAPWYVVPADHKWYARLLISRIVLDELKKADPKWPVLDGEEQEKLAAYRELLLNELGEEPEEKKESGKKLKPSDTAVGIALRSDRQALSEKKFRKLLKKSVFENFSERFGVSGETQERLGKIYFDFEEQEAAAEAEDVNAVKELYRGKKDALDELLAGKGKEAKKLFSRCRKTAKTLIDSYEDEIGIGYAGYEERLKQFMTEYEIAVSTEDGDAETALTGYEDKVRAAYDEYRVSMAVLRAATEEKLIALFAEYTETAQAFSPIPEETSEEEPAEEETDADLPENEDESDKTAIPTEEAISAENEGEPASFAEENE